MKWWIFLKERFDPISHLTMILLFVCGHILLARSMGLIVLTSWQFFFLFLGVIFFFLKLRFYDEIKDYQTDLTLNPTRPLPRGLIKHRDLHYGIVLAIGVELISFGLCTKMGLITSLLAIAYSLLMFKEFFIGKWIRPHLTTYAMSHTIVTILLSLTIFSSLTGLSPQQLPSDLILFSIVSWLLFNIFEFGRKSYLENEERPQVPTYSNLFSRWGAFTLVLFQSLVATYLLLKMNVWSENFRLLFIGIMLGLIIVGLLYCRGKLESSWGKIYRAFTSFYIVLIYGASILHFIL